VFKAAQSFANIPSGRIPVIMTMFTNSLGVECTHCHAAEGKMGGAAPESGSDAPDAAHGDLDRASVRGEGHTRVLLYVSPGRSETGKNRRRGEARRGE